MEVWSIKIRRNKVRTPSLQRMEIPASSSFISELYNVVNIGKPEIGKRKCYYYQGHHFCHNGVFSVSVKNSKKQNRLEIFLTLKEMHLYFFKSWKKGRFLNVNILCGLHFNFYV